jgi:glycosyltransferase involved in cell wall biosynthesis
MANDGRFDVVLAYACQWTQAPEVLRHLRIPAVYFAQEGRRRSTERGYNPSARERSTSARLLWSVGSRVYDFAGRALDRRAMRSGLPVLTNSEWSARNLLSAYGVQADVVLAGVDVDRFTPDGSLPRRGVLFVGALDPTKGADLVVDALALVPAERRPALTLVFNRANDAFIESVRQKARAGGVILVERRDISDDELVTEYRSAQLLVAAARGEPFGLTIPEATAAGTPTVAVAEGGYLETVRPNVNGILVDRTPDAIARAVDSVVLGHVAFDAQALAAYARDAWSWERCARDILEHLRRAATA